MLPLISASETEDVVTTNDTAVKMAQEEREPVRALPKREVTLTQEKPTVFKVRPLRSREMIRVINASTLSTTEGLLRAAEIGTVSISNAVTRKGEIRSASSPQAVDDLIDELPHASILAIGAFCFEASTLPNDPTEASA